KRSRSLPRLGGEYSSLTAATLSCVRHIRWNLLLAVALLALVVRLVYIKQIANAPFYALRIGDAAAYHQWALQIAGGDWLGRGVGVFYQAPLYPYFLAVVYRAFGDSAAMLRFIQA